MLLQIKKIGLKNIIYDKKEREIMIKSKDELMEDIKVYIGDDTSNEAIELIENISDSINSYTADDTEDWKTKYDELDKSWRAKYKERFFNTEKTDEPNELDETEEIEEKKNYKYEDLFEEKETK